MRVSVVALTTVDYEGRRYLRGESFSAKKIDAAILAFKKRVRVGKPAPAAPSVEPAYDPVHATEVLEPIAYADLVIAPEPSEAERDEAPQEPDDAPRTKRRTSRRREPAADE